MMNMTKPSLASNNPVPDVEVFNALSSFYISVWAYVNTFFDDSRWLQTFPTLIDPYVKLGKSLERIQHDKIDGVIYK